MRTVRTPVYGVYFIGSFKTPLAFAFCPQVYAHYRPMPNKSPVATRQGSERDLDLSAIEPGRETEAVTVRERLSITCRLVKDFQQEIQLLARSDRIHYSTATYLLVCVMSTYCCSFFPPQNTSFLILPRSLERLVVCGFVFFCSFAPWRGCRLPRSP